MTDPFADESADGEVVKLSGERKRKLRRMGMQADPRHQPTARSVEEMLEVLSELGVRMLWNSADETWMVAHDGEPEFDYCDDFTLDKLVVDSRQMEMQLPSWRQSTGGSHTWDAFKHDHQWSPTRQYLAGLDAELNPEYDTKNLLDDCWPGLLSDDAADRRMRRWWAWAMMLAVVAKNTLPARQSPLFDFMGVLVSQQKGIGKGSFVGSLLEPGKGHSEQVEGTPVLRDTEASARFFPKLVGRSVVEIEEVSVADDEHRGLRAYVSKSSLRIRRLGSSHYRMVMKSWIDIGTTNLTHFLPYDSNGERRIVPIVIGSPADGSHFGGYSVVEHLGEHRDGYWRYALAAYERRMEANDGVFDPRWLQPPPDIQQSIIAASHFHMRTPEV